MKLIDLGVASAETKATFLYTAQEDASKLQCSVSPVKYYRRSATNSASIQCDYTD